MLGGFGAQGEGQTGALPATQMNSTSHFSTINMGSASSVETVNSITEIRADKKKHYPDPELVFIII